MCVYAVADPDLPIKGWGSGGSQKNFFPALLASVWSKNPVGGGVEGGGPCPESPTDMYMYAVGVCF